MHCSDSDNKALPDVGALLDIHSSQDPLDSFYGFLRFPLISSVTMGRGESTRIIVKVLAGRTCKLILQCRTTEYSCPDLNVAASHPVRLFHHLGTKQ